MLRSDREKKSRRKSETTGGGEAVGGREAGARGDRGSGGVVLWKDERSEAIRMIRNQVFPQRNGFYRIR